jgi:hypothetical protein
LPPSTPATLLALLDAVSALAVVAFGASSTGEGAPSFPGPPKIPPIALPKPLIAPPTRPPPRAHRSWQNCGQKS